MNDWTAIHWGFAEKDIWGKTYQQNWEEKNFTAQEAQTWILIGLEPKEYELAAYCRGKNYLTKDNWKELREEVKNTQNYLDFFYPLTSRKSITYLNLNWKYLTNSLALDNFINLTELYCSHNHLTSLTINNCPNLKEIYCSDNQLTTLELSNNNLELTELNCCDNHLSTLIINNCPNLKVLFCHNCRLTDCIPFKNLINCEKLWLSGNPLTGSLAPLAGLGNLKELHISNTNLTSGLEYLPESLRKLYCDDKLAEQLKDYKEDSYYNYQAWWRKEFQTWIKQGFTKQQVYQWTEAGAKISDHGFVTWFRDTKKLGPEWITNYQADYQSLSDRFKKYGPCQECKQLNTGEQWCKECNEPRLKENFTNWTSHNPQVDKFIKEHQLKATDADKFIEWIPYQQFINIEYLAEGGFGKVYKAQWMAGNIHYWDQSSKQWVREKDQSKNYREVVLKILTNSKDNTDFLQETEKHKIIDDWFQNIVPCYGLSQDQDGNYLMVMQYMPERDLRNYLRKNNRTLTLQIKVSQLFHIAQGLKDLHQKNLVHRDFHSGNILKGIEQTDCLITDLGLCKPVGETKEEKVFGVLPYVAPEVLQNQPYAQAADIYSFGIIAYELLSGLPPYYDKRHDVQLGIEICRGLRPQFQIEIPQLLEELIKRCWDTNPEKRPTAYELEKILRKWEQEINLKRENEFNELDSIESVLYSAEENELSRLFQNKERTQFVKQLQEAEEHNKNLPEEVKFPKYEIHHGAVYHSKLLPTKEITQLLQNFQDNEQIYQKTSELNQQLKEINKLSVEINKESSQEDSYQAEKQKRNALKEALNCLLEKSQNLSKEIEKIVATNPLISQETNKLLAKLKTKLADLQTKDHTNQKLQAEKFQKEEELKELKNTVITNNHLDEDDLEDLLEDQEQAVHNPNEKTTKKIERTKKRLTEKIMEAEINSLCQLQIAITKLEIELNKNLDHKTKQITSIINNINASITIDQGNVLIGNQIGDNANFPHHTNDQGNLIQSLVANATVIDQLDGDYITGDKTINTITELINKRTRQDSWEENQTKKIQEGENSTSAHTLQPPKSS